MIRNPLSTDDGFFQHAKSIIKPALDKYDKLYNLPTVDMYASKRAMNACKIFDPFLLVSKETSHATLYLFVDEHWFPRVL